MKKQFKDIHVNNIHCKLDLWTGRVYVETVLNCCSLCQGRNTIESSTRLLLMIRSTVYWACHTMLLAPSN